MAALTLLLMPSAVRMMSLSSDVWGSKIRSFPKRDPPILSNGFEGIEDTTLTGKNGDYKGPYFHCTRLVAIQLS